MSSVPLCWICNSNPADTSEHRFKASNIRKIAPKLTQQEPIYLQRDGEATNVRVGSARSDNLKFSPSICAYCNNTRTQAHDKAWHKLSVFLLKNWKVIRKQRNFDLSKVFFANIVGETLNVHLYFLKMLGCKILENSVPIEIEPLSTALMQERACPEVSLFVVHSPDQDQLLMWESEVHTMRNERGTVDGAVWMYLLYPVGIKVSYIVTGAPLRTLGHPWHPIMTARYIKLSPYKGGTEPDAGPTALLP